MQRSLIALALSCLSLPVMADPNLVPKLGSGEMINPNVEMFDNRYQIGSEWGKKPVTADEMQQSPALQSIASVTGKLNNATAFYLGKFANYQVVATNHHVCPSDCTGLTIRFPVRGATAQVVKQFGSWTDIDLALLAVTMNDSDAQKLAPYAQNFDFSSRISAGEDLVTVGFGVADNPRSELMGNEDSDCKVFSTTDNFHYMADPDRFNPGPYKAWSFAHGCDVSHGDSGSAMVDRQTGHIVGIVWTGRIPKAEKIQDSNYLDTIVGTDDPAVWEELSYAVPASKIAEHLEKVMQTSSTGKETKMMLGALLPHYK